MPFAKGKSGNPGGRPKVDDEVKTLAKDHGLEAAKRLIALMRDKLDKRLACKAAIELLNRGFGKPLQSTELTGKDGADLFKGMPTDELKERLKAVMSEPETMRLLN